MLQPALGSAVRPRRQRQLRLSAGRRGAALFLPSAEFPQRVTGKTVKDPVTGLMLQIPPLYGVNLALAGNKYQLRASLTKSSDNSLLDDSVGFYAIKNDGSIGNVQMLVPSVKNWPKGETDNFSVNFDDNVMGIGLFVVPDGYRMMNGYKDVDLSHLKFVSGNAASPARRAPMITDQYAARAGLVRSGDRFRDHDHRVLAVSARIICTAISIPAGPAIRCEATAICHLTGEKVGPNHDFTCERATTLDAGRGRSRPSRLCADRL